MIKNRRESTRPTNRRPAARKPTAADKAIGKARASRTAKITARRGIERNTQAQGKPSAMEIEREVYRQTRMNNDQPKGKKQQRSRKDSAAQVKARKQQKTETKKMAAKKDGANVPPTWVSGTRRPPSKKAVNAAVTAMTNHGFKIPPGMQMVISFAPAPEKPPPNQKKNKGNQQGNQKGGDAGNKGKQNKGGGQKK